MADSELPAAPAERAAIAYPPELAARELALLQTRRASFSPDGLADTSQAVGFALSGGGIRSATFNLGVFQALGRLSLLRRIDYLSTVSGGGYFGAFLGRLFTRKDMNAAEVERVLAQQSRREVLRHLRENGRYLSPHGAGDLLLDGAVLFRNWNALLLVIAVSLISAFLAAESVARGAHVLTGAGYETVERALNAALPFGLHALWWSVWTALPIALLALVALPIGIAYWLGPWSASLLLAVGLALGVVRGMPLLQDVPELLRAALFAVPLAAGLFFWSARKMASDQSVLAHDSAHRNRLSRWLKVALFGSCALLLFALIDSVGRTLHLAIASSLFDTWVSWLVGSAAALLAGFSAARRITISFARRPTGRRVAPPMALLATLAALLVGALLLVAASTAAHALAAIGRPAPSAEPWLHLPAPARQVVYAHEGEGFGAGLEVALVREPGAQRPAAGRDRSPTVRDLAAPLIALAIGLCACVLFGHAFRFLTRSSHHPLYSARLTRAYLGASNRKRLANEISVTQVVADDDIHLSDYYATEAGTDGPPPPQKGAPLHLINVTINETIDGRSQVQQQDRKGVGMAIGPCAISVGVRHHAVLGWSDPAQVQVYPAERTTHRVFELRRPGFAPERLSLGQWVAISGAAFSTGIGARTNLGLSLLAGLTNIRLGYWWDAGLARASGIAERLFAVQAYLLRELLARFSGTAHARWYLSDGGHFENMGAYELVRRRLARIVVIDAEADPEYTFEGLANLVRKARMDFGAEIVFWTEQELTARIDPRVRPLFGTLEQLRRGTWTSAPRFRDGVLQASHVFQLHDDGGLSLGHAAVADVHYDGASQPGLLLYVKPTLTGNEPADLTQYHAEHPPFPQETTADQFFDEAQWESYRKLGDHIATSLFADLTRDASTASPADTGVARWSPRAWLVQNASPPER